LVEVLVATVLLAIGICGTVASLAAAERLRADANRRERLAAEVNARLAWFDALGCSPTATGGATTSPDGVQVAWTLTAVDADSIRRVDIDAVHGLGSRALRLSIATGRLCR
jgi:Tfp pilus assembly protein PilV